MSEQERYRTQTFIVPANHSIIGVHVSTSMLNDVRDGHLPFETLDALVRDMASRQLKRMTSA